MTVCCSLLVNNSFMKGASCSCFDSLSCSCSCVTAHCWLVAIFCKVGKSAGWHLSSGLCTVCHENSLLLSLFSLVHIILVQFTFFLVQFVFAWSISEGWSCWAWSNKNTADHQRFTIPAILKGALPVWIRTQIWDIFFVSVLFSGWRYKLLACTAAAETEELQGGPWFIWPHRTGEETCERASICPE